MEYPLTDSYTVLAQYYDQLMSHVPYSRWIKFIDYFAHKNSRQPLRIVDAGCGTGTVAIGLARLGHRVVGLDESAEMLAVAQAKSQHIPITWVQNNFVQLDIPADMVVCTCDGVNHLLKVRDVTSFFRRAHACLSNFGCLIFDINTDYKYRRILANNVFAWTVPPVDVVWLNHFRRPYNTAAVTLYRRCGKLYSKSTFEIKERCHPMASLVYYLGKCGFHRIELWDNYKRKLGAKPSQRITVVAQKSKGS